MSVRFFDIKCGALGCGSVTWLCLAANAFGPKGGEAEEVPGTYLSGHTVNVCQSTRCVSVSSVLCATWSGCLQDDVDPSLRLDQYF